MAPPNSSAAPGSARDLVSFVEVLVSGSTEFTDDQITRLAESILQLSPSEDFENVVDKNLRPKVENNIKDGYFEETDMDKMTVIHLAAIEGSADLMKVLARRRTFLRDINATNAEGRTPLHLAALTRKSDIVEFLITNGSTKRKVRGDVEDNLGQTAYEIAVELQWHEIVRDLMDHPDVARYLEARRADRNVYGGGTNAILVGAALIASITFAGWLQPPLSYQQYYQYPRNATMAGAPPDVFQQYAAISEHLTVKVFWIANSLSFYCAIAAILAGAAALVPRGGLHELAEVRRLRGAVYLAGFALSWAVLFVVVAFTAAGFASLPPIMKYEVYMIVTLVIGLLVCLHGFSSARISEPFVFNKYSFIIDPAFYFSKLSGLLEGCCECFPWLHYQSLESRIRERNKVYHRSVRGTQNPANEGTLQALNGQGGSLPSANGEV